MTLYEAGKDAMEKEFRNLLARHGRPVPPGSLLDVLALEHGNHNYLPLLMLLLLLASSREMQLTIGPSLCHRLLHVTAENVCKLLLES